MTILKLKNIKFKEELLEKVKGSGGEITDLLLGILITLEEILDELKDSVVV